MLFQVAPDAGREVSQKVLTPCRKLLKRTQCVAKHGLHTDLVSGLIQGPKSFREVRVEFEELVQKLLGDLLGSQMELVQRPEQRQQLQTGTLQAWTKILEAARQGGARHHTRTLCLNYGWANNLRLGGSSGEQIYETDIQRYLRVSPPEKAGM